MFATSICSRYAFLNSWCLAAGVLWSATFCGSLSAREPVLDQVYGKGVHAFFRHDYFQAEELFNLAIAHGSQDPRVYYFRGLAMCRLGRAAEAESDFRTGATLEETVGGYQVGWALERIQGAERRMLEKIRLDVRLEYLQVRPDHSLPVMPGHDPMLPHGDEVKDPFVDDKGGPLGAEAIEPAPATESEPDTNEPAKEDNTAPPEGPDPFDDAPAEANPSDAPAEAPLGVDADSVDSAPADAAPADAAPADEDPTFQ